MPYIQQITYLEPEPGKPLRAIRLIFDDEMEVTVTGDSADLSDKYLAEVIRDRSDDRLGLTLEHLRHARSYARSEKYQWFAGENPKAGNPLIFNG